MSGGGGGGALQILSAHLRRMWFLGRHELHEEYGDLRLVSQTEEVQQLV